jgi:hypothetical protein
MKLRLRYLSAVLINVALPWLAYRLAYPHGGLQVGLAASALPPIAWMSWDYLRHRHVDALSALVLAGITLSLAALLAGGDVRLKPLEDPMVSGMIGATFLLSLLLPRPLVFYLARSTISREDPQRAAVFEQQWRERPKLVAYIRLMTVVWGIGMLGENLLRSAIVWQWPDDPRSALASKLLSYAVYGGLMLWTLWCRRLIRRDALRYPPDRTTTDKPLTAP